MWQSRTLRFEPSFEPNSGLTYRDLEAHGYVGIDKQMQLLESLEAAGIIATEKPHSVLLKCNVCRSANFSLTPSCTVCGSSAIVHGSVIEHHRCGNVDFDDRYISSANNNMLVCPKCGKKLKALGVDYSKPGSFYRCTVCNALLPAMETRCTCIQCGNSANLTQLQSIRVSAYVVNTERVSEIILSRAQQDQRLETGNLVSVAEVLRHFGLDCAAPVHIQGLSKIRHRFDLIIYNENKEPKLIVDMMRVRYKGADTDETAILAFYAKCMDLYFLNKSIVHRVFFTQSELRGNAKKLAETYGITNLVNSDPSNKQRMASMVAQHLLGIL
jgi:hypothetical protein